MITAKNDGALTLRHWLALEACYELFNTDHRLNILHMIWFTCCMLRYTETPPTCVTVTSVELVSTPGEFWVCCVSSLLLNITATTTNAIKSSKQTPAIPITSGFIKLVSRGVSDVICLISSDVVLCRVSAGSDNRRIILMFVPWPCNPISCVSPISRRYNLRESLNKRLSTSDKMWEVTWFSSVVEPPTERAGLGRLSEVTE